MADMQKRHHRLISDALVEGIVACADNEVIRQKTSMAQNAAIARETILCAVARDVARSMAAKLQHTNDNFDTRAAGTFESDLVRRVSEALREKRQAEKPAA